MSIELRDAVNGDGLFDILGKAFYALDTLNTARGTTVSDEVDDFLEQFKLKADAGLDLKASVEGGPSALSSWQNDSALASWLRSACEKFLIETVEADTDLATKDLTNALDYLIADMELQSAWVVAPAVTLTLATDTDNVGDVAVCYTSRRGDGQTAQNSLAEIIEVEVVSDGSANAPGLQFTGEEAAASILGHKWPMGSGINARLTATAASSSLLSNGDFEDETQDNIPDNWIVGVGVPGQTVKVTNPGVQTVAISGTPTGGTYVLRYTNALGVVRATTQLAYNATASAVQTALRKLPGLESVTVSATGTTPNYTHTITFIGLGGAITALTSLNYTTGGTITHATTRPGDDGSYKGKALCLEAHNDEQTTLYHALTLEPETVYFCHLRIARRDVAGESSETSSSSSSSVSSSNSSSTSSQSASSASSSLSSASSASSSSVSSSSSSSNSSSSQSTSLSSASSISTSSPSSASSPSSNSSSASVSSASSLSVSSASSASSVLYSSSSSSSRSSASSASGSSASSSSSSQSASESSISSESSSQAVQEMLIDIVTSIGGSVVADAAGVLNQLQVDLDGVSRTAHDSRFFTFRTQRSHVNPVYLRVKIQSPMDSGAAVFLDEMAVVKGTELYAGGPWVAAFAGATAAVNEDNWTLTVANSRAGKIQEWFNRCFDMSGKALLLPTSGTVAIPESVIS